MAYNHNKIEFVLDEVTLALWGRSRLTALAKGTCVRCGKPILGSPMLRQWSPRLRQCLDLALCQACLHKLEVNDV